MKHLIKIFCMSVMSFLTVSCSTIQSQDMWMIEIEDDFKTQILSACLYLSLDEGIVEQSLQRLDDLATKIDDEKSTEADVAKYAEAMKQLASTDVIIKALYEEYQNTTLHFSDFTQCPDDEEFSVWSATELETNINFQFKINKLLQWEVVIEEEDFTNYLMKLLELEASI